MLSYGVIYYLGSAKVCSPAIIERGFSNNIIWIAVTDYYMYFYLIVLFYWCFSSINKFYSFII